MFWQAENGEGRGGGYLEYGVGVCVWGGGYLECGVGGGRGVGWGGGYGAQK